MKAICLRKKSQTAALTTEKASLCLQMERALSPLFEYILYSPRPLLLYLDNSDLQQSYVSTETEVKIYRFIARRRRA
jgi:hypothetical protein